jgi:uncharacterized protein (DUF1330 family)
MSLAYWIAQLEIEAKQKLDALGAEAEQVIEKIGPVVVADIEQTLEALGKLALNAVIIEAPKLISGNEKFGNAVTNIVQTVEGQGKAILVQDAQMAVQSAYYAFKLAVSTP